MAAVKVSEKQKISKKIVAILKKHYSGNVPKEDRPVLETVLYGICLENITNEEADTVYAKLFDTFHDLNEARVSSMFEMTTVFETVAAPEWKAMRVRKTLQHVFETHYSYDLEKLKRKTIELAQKHLKRIKALSPFARSYTLQESLGSHSIPLDEKMKNAAIFLGFADVNMKDDDASAAIKPAVKKTEVPVFCYYLRCLATDPKLKLAFEPEDGHPEEGYDILSAVSRLEAILKNPPKPKRKPAKKKATPKKAAGKKTATKKAATKKAGSTKKSATKKATGTKKTATKKTATKKAATKKAVTKKAATKKAATKKTVTKKAATAKKTVKKKVVKKKAASTKKSAPKKKTTTKKTVKKKTTKKKSK